VAAGREVESSIQLYNVGTVTLDRVLEAQQRQAVAEADYYRSLVDYNKAIAEVHLRKGSLLEYNGVQLAEGPWPGKAYFDACRRARSRDAGIYLDYGFTRPKVISRGQVQQQVHGGAVYHEGTVIDQGPVFGDGPTETIPPGDLKPEPIPTPIPVPSAPTPDFGARGLQVPGTLPGVSGAAVATAEEASPGLASAPDIGAGLGRLISSPQPGPAASAERAVQAAGYHEPLSVAEPDQPGTPPAAGGWKPSTSSKRHESVSHPSPAETDRSASGWRPRAQR
jgi:hypothetical protein